jgi:hypothetical protein
VGNGVSVGVGLEVEVGVNVRGMAVGVGTSTATSWARLLNVQKIKVASPINPIQIRPTIANAIKTKSLFDCPLPESTLMI